MALAAAEALATAEVAAEALAAARHGAATLGRLLAAAVAAGLGYRLAAERRRRLERRFGLWRLVSLARPAQQQP